MLAQLMKVVDETHGPRAKYDSRAEIRWDSPVQFDVSANNNPYLSNQRNDIFFARFSNLLKL